jgi:hypothetical protein
MKLRGYLNRGLIPFGNCHFTRSIHKALVTILASGTCLFFSLPNPATAHQVFDTQHAVIYYENPSDLWEMERCLHDFNPVTNNYQPSTYSQDPAQALLAPGLAARVDGLVTKVCHLLSRRPRNNQKVRIFLLQDGRQVRQRHLVLQPFKKGPSFFGYGSLEAFYESRTRSIVLSLADLHAGILAHEITHFILCESYTRAPPASVQEDWARYAESEVD